MPASGLRPTLLLVFLTAQSTAAIAAAQNSAYQVADIAPNAPAQNHGGTVYPGFFQPVTDGDVFLAPAGTGFPSIWRTDGTPEGTRPVVAGAAIGNGALIGSNGQRAYFAASDSSGATAFWATDGTPGGTVLLKAGLDPGSFEPETAVLEGRLFFQDCSPQPSTACDLWTSDGTVEGTRKLAELRRRATRLTGSAGVFYFLAPTVDDFRQALWRTDGTPGGTISLRTFSNVGPPTDVGSVGGRALVAAEGKLWVSNGTAVDPIATLGSQEYVTFLGAAVAGGTLYFLAGPLNGGTTLTVWRSDGTPAGTSRVLSTPVANSPSTPYPWVQQHGSRVYYLVPGPQGREPYTLWSSGAGGQGAQPVTCGGCASIPDPGWILVAGGELLFPAVSGAVHTLWAVDSAHVPRSVAPYCTGYCRTDAAVVVDAKAMFTLGSHELWVTDGTLEGTMLVRDVHPGLAGSTAGFWILPAGDRAFLGVDDGLHGAELWVTDGTPGGTQLVADLNPGPAGSAPEPTLTWNGLAVLSVDDGLHGREPWLTDGTVEGTRLLKDVNPGPAGSLQPSSRWALFPTWLATSWGPLLFVADDGTHGQELWASDGTEHGTVLLQDAMPGATGGSAHSLTEWAGAAYYTGRDPAAGKELWRTDGTAAGTQLVRDINPGAEGSFPADFAFLAFPYAPDDVLPVVEAGRNVADVETRLRLPVLGVIPFGLIYGVLAITQAHLPPAVAQAMSAIE